MTASVLEATGVLVEATGGEGFNKGSDGRFIIATSVVGGFSGDVVGATLERYMGPLEENTLLESAIQTPPIPDLKDGADTHGFLEGVAPDSLTTKPERGRVAILRQHIGPGNYDHDFNGYDFLLLVNVSNQDLVAPLLGLSTSNSGTEDLQPLGILPRNSVYATLVPEGEIWVQAEIQGLRTLPTLLQNDSIYYLRSHYPIPTMPLGVIALLVLCLMGMSIRALRALHH